jgi:hypothetical protein
MTENEGMEREDQERGDFSATLRLASGAFAMAIAAGRPRLTAEQNAQLDRALADGSGKIVLGVACDGVNVRAELALLRADTPMFSEPFFIFKGSVLGLAEPSDLGGTH